MLELVRGGRKEENKKGRLLALWCLERTIFLFIATIVPLLRSLVQCWPDGRSVLESHHSHVTLWQGVTGCGWLSAICLWHSMSFFSHVPFPSFPLSYSSPDSFVLLSLPQFSPLPEGPVPSFPLQDHSLYASTPLDFKIVS